MKLFRVSWLTLIGVPRTSLRKFYSHSSNLEKIKITKLINEQSIETVVEETVELYKDNDPYSKLLTMFLFIFTKNIKNVVNYKIMEGKVKEIIIRMTIQYLIHEIFHIIKIYISVN